MITLLFKLIQFVIATTAIVAVYGIRISLIAVVLFVIDPDTAFFLETVVIPLLK